MKQIALIAFAVITGALAALLKVTDADLPIRKYLLIIFGAGTFAALVFFICYAIWHRISINYILTNRHEFIKKRKSALTFLECVIFISLLSFEISLVVFVFHSIGIL